MLLPVFALAGCGPYSCFNNSVEQGGSGTVTFVNPPTTATPGSTLQLDLTGSTLPGHCIYWVSSILEGDSAWTARWQDKDQDNALFKPTKACETFRGTIDVPIPDTFAGGALTVRISSKAQNTALLFTVGTRYTAQADLKLTVAAPATPSAPTARVFPHYLRMVSTEDAARTIDARASTDPQGQVLTYTWDTNNDGVYGDPVEETGTAGVVRIPAATLNAIGGRFAFGVKATNTSGLSATATARAEVNQARRSGEPVSSSRSSTRRMAKAKSLSGPAHRAEKIPGAPSRAATDRPESSARATSPERSAAWRALSRALPTKVLSVSSGSGRFRLAAVTTA